MRKRYEKVLKNFFHHELLCCREQLGLSQEEMAHTLSISTRSYFDLEHGKSFCSLFTFLLFLRIYDDPAHTLVLNRRNGETVYYDVEQIQTNDNQTKSGVIDLFVDWLNGKDVDAISGESVLPAMRAIFAVLEASEKKCVVRVGN